MSLVNPSIDKLVNQVNNKYTLCMLAAKRAREIGDVKAKAIKKARKLNESKSAEDKNMAKLIITKVNAAGKEVSAALKEFEAAKSPASRGKDDTLISIFINVLNINCIIVKIFMR